MFTQGMLTQTVLDYKSVYLIRYTHRRFRVKNHTTHLLLKLILSLNLIIMVTPHMSNSHANQSIRSVLNMQFLNTKHVRITTYFDHRFAYPEHSENKVTWFLTRSEFDWFGYNSVIIRLPRQVILCKFHELILFLKFLENVTKML